MIDEISYCYMKGIVVIGKVTDDNILILDSYRVISDAYKKEVILNLLKSFPWFRETRTCQDMLDEWRVHNFCYSINFKRKSTQHVDFELKQNKLLRFVYWLVSKFIKKNV